MAKRRRPSRGGDEAVGDSQDDLKPKRRRPNLQPRPWRKPQRPASKLQGRHDLSRSRAPDPGIGAGHDAESPQEIIARLLDHGAADSTT